MEAGARRNARFCLICNYVNKIIPALQSRCTRFRFPPLPQEFVKARLMEICGQESIQARPLPMRPQFADTFPHSRMYVPLPVCAADV